MFQFFSLLLLSRAFSFALTTVNVKWFILFLNYNQTTWPIAINHSVKFVLGLIDTTSIALSSKGYYIYAIYFMILHFLRICHVGYGKFGIFRLQFVLRQESSFIIFIHIHVHREITTVAIILFFISHTKIT